MEIAVNAAGWVVGKALAPITGGLLEAWAASNGLGPNVDALKVELLYAQAMLDNAQGREIRSPALKALLLKLRQLAYDADDVLDELDYFRIQDELDGTYHAADARAVGCVHGLVLNACHTAKAVAGKLKPSSSSKLKFNRVEISAKMMKIIEHLKPIRAQVSNILNLEFMGTNRIINKDIAMKRPITTSDIIENELYGRDTQKKRIVGGITSGEYFANQLSVLPIVGHGGIGKTTFTQHIYKDVLNHFDVSIWICVSLNFNTNKLAQEAVKRIPKVDGEKENSSDQELIEQSLKDKRFLLVLDDMWTCDEDEWKKLLAPFRKGGKKGNMVILTTRIPEVARMVNPSIVCWIKLERLEDEDFMHLFEACVFGSQQPWEDRSELLGVGREIVSKLKGFPLAAKTVGRLLSNQLTLEHWQRVLESKEWELQTNENDIMPALKISYDYLPFHLQQCFYYCALFPEDYEFNSKELVHLWLGLDIVHPCDLRRKIEDVGHGYLTDLVNHGFFKKNERNDGCPYYVVHDLLHDLAMNISSFECLSIHSSNLKSIQIPQYVRHLSIIVDDKDIEDINTFKYYKKDLNTLDKRLKVQNLRTLMLFGEHHGIFAKTFGHLFEEATALRTIYLSGASYIVEDMLCNFSKLVHLCYIRITSKYSEGKCLLSALSRLYHLEVIDLQKWKGCSGSARHISNLVKLRHFLVPKHELQLHSDIVEVGKLKLLQELRSFEVGKESKGFELSQLGNLFELGDSLAIGNLERIRVVEEASEVKLIHKNRLHKLILEWDANRPKRDPTHEENTLEILIPHDNLQDLCIRGHGGTKCPQWLGDNLTVKNLESLHLDGVAWKTFPPIGELCLVNEPHKKISSNVSDSKFQNLRKLELVKLPRFEKWVVDTPCQLFARLEVLIIKDCSALTELSFSHSTCCQQEKEANINVFHRLRELEIEDCLKLLSFPPVPWISAQCSTKIEGICYSFKELVCQENYMSEYSLKIKGKDDPNSMFWNVLAFDNLSKLEVLKMDKCPPLPVHHFKMLSSLKTLELYDSSIVFPLVEGEGRTEYQFPIEYMTIDKWGASAKELTQLLIYFPKLSYLNVQSCKKITRLGVEEQQKKIEAPSRSQLLTYFLKLSELIGWFGKKITWLGVPARPPSSAINEAEDAQIEPQQQHDARGEEEIAAAATEGLLLLPPQLQNLQIRKCRNLVRLLLLPPQLQTLEIYLCPNLVLCPESLGAGPTRGGGGGLQALRSLRSLKIIDCPWLLSSYSPSPTSSRFPFPNSLEKLLLMGPMGTSLLPLSNLTSLTSLCIWGCGDLRGEGLGRLLTHAHLTELAVHGTPNFFVGSEPSQLHEQELPPPSSKMQGLYTDDAAGVLAAPIWTLLSSSLTILDFGWDGTVERFTKEQEEALQLLASLEYITFRSCEKLQCLPAGLYRLPNLKRLGIYSCAALRSLPRDDLAPSSLQELEIGRCPAIRSLPKECLPSSLQKLGIGNCSAIRSLPKDGLPSSLQELMISSCPAIRSLPKVDDLPSSLRVLDVCDSESEELRKQCRKLIGTIPIVRT